VVKIEYKYCPNLTIIDTPGLISAPSKGRASPLQGQARAVEALVKQKMENRDYIILCLEDTSDWSNATTRNLVLEVRHAPPPPRSLTLLASLVANVPKPSLRFIRAMLFGTGCLWHSTAQQSLNSLVSPLP